jgi:hypothetical protein
VELDAGAFGHFGFLSTRPMPQSLGACLVPGDVVGEAEAR